MASKEKVVCWLSDFPLRGSSFGNVSFELLTRIPEYKFEVLSLGYEGIPLRIGKNVRVFELQKSYQAKYYFEKLKPDITVVFHSYWFLDSLGSVMSYMKGKRILYIPVEGERVPVQYRKHFLNFDQIITPSEYSRKVLKKSGIKAKVVPHGVDNKFFVPSKKKKAWHEFRFGYLGMNDVRKQVPRVMEAYARLKSGMLVLATPSEGHYSLIDIAKEYKISPIFIEQKLNGLRMSREAIRDFLQSLDAYISPATEGFGLPALEAAACGVPTIALDHGAARDVLSNGALYAGVSDYLQSSVGKVGLISTADLYRKMRFMMQVPNAREKLAKKALANSEKWTWEKAVDLLKEALKE